MEASKQAGHVEDAGGISMQEVWNYKGFGLANLRGCVRMLGFGFAKCKDTA
jgi:hypothetical protein